MERTHDHVLAVSEAVLVVIDVQTSLADIMDARDETVAGVTLLARVANRLGIPMIVTRQNPTRLGDTIPGLREVLGPHTPVDKMTFDAMAEPAFEARLEATDRRTVVITGMETHICVLQTALALLRAGYAVHVVADAVCSRRTLDRDVALDRLRAAGAVVTTVEQVVYEALGRAGTAAFRDALRFVKERDAS